MLRTVQSLPPRGFRHWASTRPVSRPSRQSATGPPDSYPDRTSTGKRRRARTQDHPFTRSPPVPLGARKARASLGRVVSSWISPKARQGVASGIAGRGLVAHEAIDAGEVVAVKGGHIVTTQALNGLSEALQNSEIQVADGLHLVAHTPEEYEAVMVFINHSCEPNVGFSGNTVLLAMSAVAAGVELTTDYAMFDDYTGQTTCRCGTASCRGTIDGQDWRRPDLQRGYAGYFSWYLQRKQVDDVDECAECMLTRCP